MCDPAIKQLPAGCNTRLLSRVSDIDIAMLSVRLSVFLSVRCVPVLYENGLTYCHSFFTTR